MLFQKISIKPHDLTISSVYSTLFKYNNSLATFKYLSVFQYSQDSHDKRKILSYIIILNTLQVVS